MEILKEPVSPDVSLQVWPLGDWEGSRLEDLELPGGCSSSVMAGAVIPIVWTWPCSSSIIRNTNDFSRTSALMSQRPWSKARESVFPQFCRWPLCRLGFEEHWGIGPPRCPCLFTYLVAEREPLHPTCCDSLYRRGSRILLWFCWH